MSQNRGPQRDYQYLRGSPPAYTSSDFVVASDAAVGFVNVTNADAGGDYHGYGLASTSPSQGRASDGTDPGVNFESLDAALALGASGSGGNSGGSGGTSAGSSVLPAPKIFRHPRRIEFAAAGVASRLGNTPFDRLLSRQLTSSALPSGSGQHLFVPKGGQYKHEAVLKALAS